LYLGLTSKIDKSKFLWLLVINLASLIHFYFTAIIFVVYSILRISNFYFEKETLFRLLKDFFIVTIFTLLTLYVVGYFEIKVVDSLGLGFGDYKLNLLSFFDPGPTANNVFWSRFLPDIKLSLGEQLEGFNYLGLGQMLMLLFAFIVFFNKKYKTCLLSIKSNKEIKIFVLISFLFTLWALSNKISIGSYTIIEIPLNKYIYGLLSIIRSSGRVFWIVNYFLLILSIIIIYTSFKKKHSLSIVILFLVIQIIDISPGLKTRIGQHTNENKSYFLEDPIWDKLFTKYKVVKTTYPESWSSLFKNFSYPMEKYNIKKTNLVMLARSNRKSNAQARYNLYSDFREKKLELDTVYVIKDQNHLRHLKNIYENENVGFFYRDNIWTMVKNEKVLMNDNDNKIFNKIKPKILNINQIKNIYFEEEDNFYGLGWSHNFKKLGIWSEGPTSTLLFKTEKNYGDLKLEIFCKPYIGKNNKILKFDIYVNNLLNKNVKLELDENFIQDRKIEILIDEELIKNDEIKIDFNFENLVSPYEMFESPDSRKLGILTKKIKITPI